MLRIFPGDYITINKADFNRKEILESYKLPVQHNTIKFVVLNQSKIVSVLDYRDILLKHNIDGNIIISSQNTFDEARKYFNEIEYLYSNSCLGVVKRMVV